MLDVRGVSNTTPYHAMRRQESPAEKDSIAVTLLTVPQEEIGEIYLSRALCNRSSILRTQLELHDEGEAEAKVVLQLSQGISAENFKKCIPYLEADQGPIPDHIIWLHTYMLSDYLDIATVTQMLRRAEFSAPYTTVLHDFNAMTDSFNYAELLDNALTTVIYEIFITNESAQKACEEMRPLLNGIENKNRNLEIELDPSKEQITTETIESLSNLLGSSLKSLSLLYSSARPPEIDSSGDLAIDLDFSSLTALEAILLPQITAEQLSYATHWVTRVLDWR